MYDFFKKCTIQLYISLFQAFDDLSVFMGYKSNPSLQPTFMSELNLISKKRGGAEYKENAIL